MIRFVQTLVILVSVRQVCARVRAQAVVSRPVDQQQRVVVGQWTEAKGHRWTSGAVPIVSRTIVLQRCAPANKQYCGEHGLLSITLVHSSQYN